MAVSRHAEESAGEPSTPRGASGAAYHAAEERRFSARADALERAGQRLSLIRLGAFVAALALVSAGVSQGSTTLLAGAAAVAALFAGAVARHLRLIAAERRARVRAEIHGRHLLRAGSGFVDLPSPPAEAIPRDHPYAFDLDLVGHASLLSRVDTTRTVAGERALVAWLTESSDRATLEARQAAVAELAGAPELCRELEAEARAAGGDAKLDPSRFFAFLRREPRLFGRWPAVLAIHLLPLATLTLFALARLGRLGYAPFGLSLGLSALVAIFSSGRTAEAFDLVAARRGYVEAFKGCLRVAEDAKLSAPLLQELQARLRVGGRPASAALTRLDRWAGLSDLKSQFPIHFFVNLAVLWDLHVLFHLERFAADVGDGLPDALDALGELEALASLATLLSLDPDASLPELAEAGALEAEGLAHPLLASGSRVPNDLSLAGPGTLLIVTGSNMAGKSTLLRAVGLNVCLALAGGPVVARRMRVPLVRLRSSMRVSDSLEEGASYFRAELSSMRRVIEDAEAAPPIFFLLDELLRGTNEEARHRGARAIVEHLLDRGAFGLVATHDVNLATLEQERPGQVENRHFTDVVVDGEMTFDYRLRPGVVQGSNALRLLAQLGVAVDAAEEAVHA